MSADIDQIKKMFFEFTDLNKDKLICETDLFRVIKSLKSNETSQMVIDDLLLVLKMINVMRKNEGKDNLHQLVQRKSVYNAELALKKAKIESREDHAHEIKMFLS